MSRIPNCMCEDCTNIGTIAVAMPDRGGNAGFMCEFHAYQELNYSRENGMHYGKEKKHRKTYSEEMETSSSDLQARAELLHFGFLPTDDATVDVEYKSPIFEGLNAISKQCLTVDKLIADGHMRIGNECGTHFHVGHADHINPRTMRYLRRFNGSLFVPLSEAIMADPAKSARLFGRQPNRWAEPITFNDPSGNYEGWQMKHEAMINLQHDYTIEFRQCKFVNAEQYMNAVKFCDKVADTLIKNFILHFNDTPNDARRYPNKTSYRKHKAQMTAQKLVKIYEDFTANI